MSFPPYLALRSLSIYHDLRLYVNSSTSNITRRKPCLRLSELLRHPSGDSWVVRDFGLSISQPISHITGPETEFSVSRCTGCASAVRRFRFFQCPLAPFWRNPRAQPEAAAAGGLSRRPTCGPRSRSPTAPMMPGDASSRSPSIQHVGLPVDLYLSQATRHPP